MGVQRTRYSPATVRKVLAAVERGEKVKDVAVRYGVGRNGILAWRRRREADPSWPDAETLAAWEQWHAATIEARARKHEWERDWRRRRIRGPVLIDGTGTRRRLRALYAMGWRAADIGERIGLGGTQVHHMARGRFPTVTRRNAERIAAVYDELSMLVGPSQYGAKRARARGCLPPLAWDDDTIDDPDARPCADAGDTGEPDPVVVARLVEGHAVEGRTRAERNAAILLLVERGMPWLRICEVLSIDYNQIRRLVRKAAA